MLSYCCQQFELEFLTSLVTSLSVPSLPLAMASAAGFSGDVQALAPATRPPLTVDGPVPVGQPHLGSENIKRVPVLADGLCLFYSILASEDAHTWLISHDAIGRPMNAQQEVDEKARGL